MGLQYSHTAIFVFDVAPRKEPPAEAVAFDVNENSVAVARVSLLSTVDAVAQWNRQCWISWAGRGYFPLPKGGPQPRFLRLT